MCLNSSYLVSVLFIEFKSSLNVYRKFFDASISEDKTDLVDLDYIYQIAILVLHTHACIYGPRSCLSDSYDLVCKPMHIYTHGCVYQIIAI